MRRQQSIKEIMFGIKCKYNKKRDPSVDRQGFTVIEILIVIAVFIIIFVSVLGFFTLDARLLDINKMKLKALSMAEEGVEIVRFVRDNQSWASTLAVFNLNSAYHPAISGSSWNIISGSENINGFTRSIIFSAVSRDANDNIEDVYNSANNDPNTKKVTVTVSWTDRSGTMSESLSAYLTNWK